MNHAVQNPRALTYARAGINRGFREKAREMISRSLVLGSSKYALGRPERLPFGLVYPTSLARRRFYDLQIEGIGTKTLLAELSGKYDTIGIDAVAMVANDVLRSGAKPLLLTDGIHIAKSDKRRLGELLTGVRLGAKLSRCVLASGETGNVTEVMHKVLRPNSPPFDMMVSCLGLAERSNLIRGAISPGDHIVGLRSSGIHSNGLTLARKILLRPWGGKYDPWKQMDTLKKPIIEELMEPTKIYVEAIDEVSSSTRLKAAVHVTGDGFAKFKRLLTRQRSFKRDASKIGLRFEGLRKMPGIFKLIYETSRMQGTPISIREMFRTFNMGYGFAVIVEPKSTDDALDSLNKHCKAEKIGQVTLDGEVTAISSDLGTRLIL